MATLLVLHALHSVQRMDHKQRFVTESESGRHGRWNDWEYSRSGSRHNCDGDAFRDSFSAASAQLLSDAMGAHGTASATRSLEREGRKGGAGWTKGCIGVIVCVYARVEGRALASASPLLLLLLLQLLLRGRTSQCSPAAAPSH